MSIVFASGNQHKLNEVAAVCGDINWVLQSKFNVPEAEENASSFIGNALLKATNAHNYTQLSVLADDSGLVVPSLQGEPGIYSARYAGINATSADNNKKLLEAMQNLTGADRSAYFVCVLVFIYKNNKGWQQHSIETKWQGKITTELNGECGFGYDPLFIPENMQITAAQLSMQEKNQISHRGQALAAFKKFYQTI